MRNYVYNVHISAFVPSNYVQETFEKCIKTWWASKGFLQPQSDFLQADHDVPKPDPAINKPHKSTKSDPVKFLNYVERIYVGKKDKLGMFPKQHLNYAEEIFHACIF